MFCKTILSLQQAVTNIEDAMTLMVGTFMTFGSQRNNKNILNLTMPLNFDKLKLR